MDEPSQQQRAKRYETTHNLLFVVETVYTILLLIAFLYWGGSDSLADAVQSISPNPWIHIAIYGAVVIVATKLLFLPLNYFGDYHLEHKFGLSNESLGAWAFDEVKSLGLNLLLSVALLDVLYFVLRRAGDWWWIGAGLCFLIFGVAMSAQIGRAHV